MNKTAIKAALNSQRVYTQLKEALRNVSVNGWPCYSVFNKKGKPFITVRYSKTKGFTLTLNNGNVLTLKQFLNLAK